MRQLVVDCDNDEGFCRVLCELKELLQLAAETSPLAGQQHLTALLRDLLTATWFKFEGSLTLAVTHKGTRPGDPAADVLFAFTLSALFCAINASLKAQGLVNELPHVRQAPLVNGFASVAQLQFVSWADDFARPFLGDSPSNLLAKVQRATKCCTKELQPAALSSPLVRTRRLLSVMQRPYRPCVPRGLMSFQVALVLLTM